MAFLFDAQKGFGSHVDGGLRHTNSGNNILLCFFFFFFFLYAWMEDIPLYKHRFESPWCGSSKPTAAQEILVSLAEEYPKLKEKVEGSCETIEFLPGLRS